MGVFCIVCVYECVSASPMSVLFASVDAIAVTLFAQAWDKKQCIFIILSFLPLSPPSIHLDFRKLMLTVLSSALRSRQHSLSISLQFKWPAFWQGLFPITGNDISFRLHHSSLPLWSLAFAFSLSLYIYISFLSLYTSLSLHPSFSTPTCISLYNPVS